MSNSTDLQRRYRRLLAFYPHAFRREHEQEILSVLMDGADPGQRRPRPSESADLLTHATLTRARQPTSWEERHHPGLWVWVRVLIGIWLVILTGILCQDGYWWGLALLAPAALHFYLALRLGRSIDSQREAGGPSPAP